jgi:hypothetical protein
MASGPSSTWHDDVFFGIHYDLHAGEGDTVLGAEITAEHLRDVFSLIRPDWVQCDCKGHPGWACWPSETTPTPPQLHRDMLAPHAQACRELGIRLGMHFSGVIDVEQLKRHPDWAAIDAEGQPSHRSTCRLSPYRQQVMIPQMLEIIDKYDVDGFWVDGENWASRPCYCDRCTERFAGETGITDPPRSSEQPGWEQWLAFHRKLFVEHVREYADAIHQRKPECAACSNWMYTIRQPEPVDAPVDYLSGDYKAIFGADRAALEARMISNQGRSWDLMAWGFTKNYDDPRALSEMKTAEHLKQEVSGVLAQGGAIMVYMKPQRTGWLVDWHHKILAEVAEFCRARKPYCFKSRSASDVAVLHLASHYYRHNDPLYNYRTAIEPVEGALNALLEAQISTDVLCEHHLEDQLDQFRLVVVPEQTYLGSRVVDALRRFAESGRTVLLSGSHLVDEVPELVGCEAASEDRPFAPRNNAWGSVFLPVGSEAVGLKGHFRDVTTTQAKVLQSLMIDGQPGKDETDKPGVTVHRVGLGQVVAVHGPLFGNYFLSHNPRFRDWLIQLIDSLKLDLAARLEGPAEAELILRRADGRLMVNIINRSVAEQSHNLRPMTRRLCPLENMTLRLRCDSPPKAVTIQPAGQPLRFTYNKRKRQATIRIGHVHCHEIIEVC